MEEFICGKDSMIETDGSCVCSGCICNGCYWKPDNLHNNFGCNAITTLNNPPGGSGGYQSVYENNNQ